MAEDGEVKRSKKNVLQQLKKMSTIVADTGNLEGNLRISHFINWATQYFF